MQTQLTAKLEAAFSMKTAAESRAVAERQIMAEYYSVAIHRKWYSLVVRDEMKPSNRVILPEPLISMVSIAATFVVIATSKKAWRQPFSCWMEAW